MFFLNILNICFTFLGTFALAQSPTLSKSCRNRLYKKSYFRSESVGRVSEGDLEQNEKINNKRRESKYERRRNIVKEYLIDYTSNSNLHGLKYIGEKERTFVEK